ncbi:MAG: hypothetical protein ABIK67_01150 [candidate division WOR-3 bacterium]
MKPINSLTICLLAISVTLAQWTTISVDTVTSLPTAKTMTMQALAIDNNQTLHAVWTERISPGINRIYYSYKVIGSTWSLPELVADSTNSDAVLGVEANSGVVHIAYTVTISTYPELFYATNRTGNWERTRLTNNDVYDYAPTIVVKGSSAHIAWITVDSLRQYRIAYGIYSSGSWYKEILYGSQLGDFGLGAAPYLALEPTGIAHISYRGGNYGNYHIHHAENPLGDTTWLYEVLYTVNANDFSSALAAKHNGELFLVCSGNDGWGFPFRTCYLHRPPNSSTWEPYQLMTGDASATLRGFALDSNFVHISWERVSGNILTEEIYHCSNFSGRWFNSGIRTDGQTSYGALVIDNNHCGHCLVVSGANIDSQSVYCLNSAPLTSLNESRNDNCGNFLSRSLRILRPPVRLKINDATTSPVSIYNSNGQKLARIPVQNDGTIVWNEPNIATGIYFCQYRGKTLPFILLR